MTADQIKDPAAALALFFGEVHADDNNPLATDVRAVLARLERAESIAKAATALRDAFDTGGAVALNPRQIVALFDLRHALAEEVRGNGPATS